MNQGKNKNVAVIVRTSPLNTLKSVEALRLGVGLTLEGNHVDVLFMEAGTWNAVPLNSRHIERPDFDQFFNSFELCGIGAFVETDALPSFYHSKVRKGIQKKSRKELLHLIGEADIVIPY